MPTLRGITQSYLLRTLLGMFLFYEPGEDSPGDGTAVKVVHTFQALVALLFTALSVFERGGAYKLIHYAEIGFAFVTVLLWVITLTTGHNYLQLVFPGVVMCWSRTLRNMAGERGVQACVC